MVPIQSGLTQRMPESAAQSNRSMELPPNRTGACSADWWRLGDGCPQKVRMMMMMRRRRRSMTLMFMITLTFMIMFILTPHTVGMQSSRACLSNLEKEGQELKNDPGA